MSHQGLVKILERNRTHYGMTYREGLNIDVNTWMPMGENLAGGIYYCKREEVYLYTIYGADICEITIPADGQRWDEYKQSKADKVIISNIRPWCEVLTEEEQLKAIRHKSWCFRYITNPSHAVQVEAARQFGANMKLIDNPVQEALIEAVKQNGFLINDLIPKSNCIEELQMAALPGVNYDIRYINDPKPAVQLRAVQEYLGNIRHIKDPCIDVRQYVLSKGPQYKALLNE